jgi:hypothetical protein
VKAAVGAALRGGVGFVVEIVEMIREYRRARREKRAARTATQLLDQYGPLKATPAVQRMHELARQRGTLETDEERRRREGGV